MANRLKKKQPAGTKNRRAQPAARPRRAVAKAADSPARLQYIPWHSVPLEALNPLLQRQFLVGQQVMLARIVLKKGCVVPRHSHHNEQLSYVLDGSLKFWLEHEEGEKEIVVRSGEVLCIPGHMAHKVEALEDSVSLDVFSPPRADWIDGTDQYLRGEP